MAPIGKLAVAEQAQISLADEGDRARVTPTAIKALISVRERWGLTAEQTAALLGVSTSTWERIVSGTWKQTLSQDQMTRISAVVGIYKGLKLLFADGMALRWPKLKNKGPLFENRTPVEAMIEGGIPKMVRVRQHVDALRGGL